MFKSCRIRHGRKILPGPSFGSAQAKMPDIEPGEGRLEIVGVSSDHLRHYDADRSHRRHRSMLS